MATDHFIKHKWAETRTDWNFNILFNDQPQVAQYAAKYKSLLDHSGLHQPVPGEWLHATVLRVGFLEDFTEAEMLEVAKRLESKIANLQMPEFLLGQWWLWGGNPCVHFTPDDPLKSVYDVLLEALSEVLGSDSQWKNQWPDRLMPHITLAYSKTYDNEAGLFRQLQTKHIEAVPVRAKRLSLIKQRVENKYYVWEVVKDIELGQK